MYFTCILLIYIYTYDIYIYDMYICDFYIPDMSAYPVAVVELPAVLQEGLGAAPPVLHHLHQLVPGVGPRDAARRDVEAGPKPLK